MYALVETRVNRTGQDRQTIIAKIIAFVVLDEISKE